MAQQGGNRTRVPDKDRAKTQGAKTQQKNREIATKRPQDHGTQ
jgi:hypothetical protein